jgi:exosortase
VSRRPCAAAWPFLLFGLLVLVVGRLAFEIHAAALSLVIVLGALVAMAGGLPLLRAVLFPLAFLIFMIPLPWALYFIAGDPLQTATAALAARLLAPLGVPMFREGTLIHLPTVTLEIEASCSGVRTALSLLPLAAAFAYLMVRRPWARVALVASALPIAILVNILRVMAIVIQAYLYPAWVTGYALHLYTSWVPMLVGLPMLFAVGGLLQWRERPA